MSGEGGREAREPTRGERDDAQFIALHFRFVLLSARRCSQACFLEPRVLYRHGESRNARPRVVWQWCDAAVHDLPVAGAQSPVLSRQNARRHVAYCTCAQMPVRICLCGYCRARRSGSAMHLHDIAHCGPCVHVGLNVASGHPCDPLVHTIACPGCVAPCCRLRHQGGCWSSWCAVTRVVPYVRVACVPF